MAKACESLMGFITFFVSTPEFKVAPTKHCANKYKTRQSMSQNRRSYCHRRGGLKTHFDEICKSVPLEREAFLPLPLVCVTKDTYRSSATQFALFLSSELVPFDAIIY